MCVRRPHPLPRDLLARPFIFLSSGNADADSKPIVRRHGNVSLSHEEEEDIHIIKDGIIHKHSLKGEVEFRSVCACSSTTTGSAVGCFRSERGEVASTVCSRLAHISRVLVDKSQHNERVLWRFVFLSMPPLLSADFEGEVR